MSAAREASRTARAVAEQVARKSQEPGDLQAIARNCEQLAGLHMQVREWDVAAALYAEILKIWDDLLAANRVPGRRSNPPPPRPRPQEHGQHRPDPARREGARLSSEGGERPQRARQR